MHETIIYDESTWAAMTGTRDCSRRALLDGDEDDGVDAITSFLEKVSWNVPEPTGWVETTTTPQDELVAAKGRVAYLEKLLAEEKARVAKLEAAVKADGVFDDGE